MNADTSSDDAATAFEALRPRLLGLAYRLLGSMWDAEDAVADASVTWLALPPGHVRNDESFLVTIVTRKALDLLGSARVRREQYVGPWLPEPALTGNAELGPAETAIQRESLSLATLRMMETLNPRERAVLVLCDVFEYPGAEAAVVLGLTAANVRQTLRRARGHLAEGPRFDTPDGNDVTAMLTRLLGAIEAGDVDQLAQHLADDVVAYSDGGGKVNAALNPIVGSAKVIRFLLGLFNKYGAPEEVRLVPMNGGIGVVMSGATSQQVFTVALRDGLVAEIDGVLNPDKIGYLLDAPRPGA